MINILKTFTRYRYLLYELVKKDLKLKYRRSFLGYIWSILNPLMMMIIVTAIFSKVFRFNITNFPVYFLTGQLLYNFFAESTSSAMMSIVDNSTLIKKVYIPKYIFPLSKTCSSFVNTLFSLTALLIILLITKTPITPLFLLLPFPFLYIYIFSLGIGLLLSVCMVYFRDIQHLYSVLIMTLMYFTPLFYPIDMVPNYVVGFIKINPLYHYITMMRNIVLYSKIPTLEENLICLSISVITLIVAIFVFRRHHKEFILYI